MSIHCKVTSRIGAAALFAAFGTCVLSPPLGAQTHQPVQSLSSDPRGEPELTLCSQNLKNYGLFALARSKDARMTPDDLKEKTAQLAQRFARAHCDVIAVQELLGKDEKAAREALQVLVTELRRLTNRNFDVRVGPPAEGNLNLGFLVAPDRADIINLVSYDKVELPKLSEKQKPRLFSRGPLEIQLAVKGRGGQPPKTVTLINIHFKSRRAGTGDPAGLEWETFRMEMAEALRRIIDRRHAKSFTSGASLLAVLGDRNSNYDVASARILEGSVKLSNFQGEAPCRLSKRGVPLCKAETISPQRLFSVLTANPKTRGMPGTFRMGDEYSWLDDIMMPAESLRAAWSTSTSEGQYESGVVYTPEDASDHAMVYVRLNWY